ncbi:EAL domain-containing protein [Novosphingobium sp. Gsoil 351]|uniref:sensor domain-containing protein n=1 Tax=Novosphingobium sp. Gsoil 351 TaxID=2675225 RepID=UPI0018A865B5|nr:EAL domain-containing protein [Novosphingobium sp. Gsoil 351]
MGYSSHQTLASAALDAVPQIVWTTDPAGVCTLLNEQWYTFTGIDRSNDTSKSWTEAVHPDDLEQLLAVWSDALSSKSDFETQFRLRAADDSYKWVLARAKARLIDNQVVEWCGICTDVDDRIRAREEASRNEILYRSIVQASADCIKIIDLHGAIQFINEPGVDACEFDHASDVLGRQWSELWPPDCRDMIRAALDGAVAGESIRCSGYCPTAKETPKWWDVSVTPVRNRAGDIVQILAISRDLTRQRHASEQLRWASEHDALTELPNRRSFEGRLQAAVLRAMESGGTVGLLLVDLDHFKHVNDSLGHLAGDRLLKILARRLRDALRASDFVARLGGDEFAVIIEQCGVADELCKIGEAILQRLKDRVRIGEREISSGASIGGAVFPGDATSANELLAHADIALYSLKESGRGGTKMFHQRMREQARLVSSQLSLARSAITRETVDPYYQQKINLVTGEIAGFEALLRWRHATQGIQLPHTVAEAFKDYELATSIGEHMQHRVFGDIRAWLEHDVPIGVVAINAAPAEFLRDDFAERLLDRLGQYSVAPHRIELEVTEHVFVASASNYVERALKLLSRAGVRIALDDFGTGYSSLSHLRDFPVDVVKIDRSFIERMSDDREVCAIVKAVIDLAASLNLEVVAEGIETEEQRRQLADLGCQYGQGYLFGRAVQSSRVRRILKNSVRDRRDCAALAPSRLLKRA